MPMNTITCGMDTLELVRTINYIYESVRACQSHLLCDRGYTHS